MENGAQKGMLSNVTPSMEKQWQEVFSNSQRTRMYFFAASSSQESFEDKDLQHGLFTYYLVEAMKQEAKAREDGVVYTGEVWRYVQTHVEERSWQRFRKRQTPLASLNFDPDFALALRRRVSPQPTDTAVAIGKPARGVAANNAPVQPPIKHAERQQASTDTRPDFGGTWRLSATASKFAPLLYGSSVPKPIPANYILRITQTQDHIIMDVTDGFPPSQKHSVETLSTENIESTSEIHIMESEYLTERTTSSAIWSGTSLTVTRKVAFENRGGIYYFIGASVDRSTVTSYWTLSADKKVLTQAVHTVPEDSSWRNPPTDDIWVFDRIL